MSGHTVDFSRCVLPPWAHQRRGVLTLLQRPRYGLFWEMRIGKTKAVVDAACFLKDAGQLDAVLIVCPAQVKAVWGHKEIGEIKKHAFVPWRHLTFDSATQDWVDIVAQETKDLLFMTVSHELLRQEDAHGDFPRVAEMLACHRGKRVWVVYDEAAAFGSHKSMQTKAALELRKRLRPSRITLLDGTPIGNSPVEQYSKFKLLGEDVLGYKNFFHFRAAHQVAQENKWAKRRVRKADGTEVLVGSGKEYVGFKNQALIDAKVRGFCEYLEQKDCLDMPEKVGSFVEVALSPKSWRRYCDFRDEMVAELDSGVLTAQHAHVKALRLAQMCSGFVGGVEDDATGNLVTQELSDETAKAALDWLERCYAQDLGFKAVVWCRWRPELERLAERISKTKKFFTKVRVVYGRRKDYGDELHPDDPYQGPMVLLAQPQAVRYGVNMSKAWAQMVLSQDYNRVTRKQSLERIVAAGHARRAVQVVDVLVTGPQGQKTVTWDIKAVQDEKEEIASRTAGEWKRVLLDE